MEFKFFCEDEIPYSFLVIFLIIWVLYKIVIILSIICVFVFVICANLIEFNL